MQSAPTRAILGFIAAAISVLTFHQAMWEALHLLAIPGMGMPPWYPMHKMPPFGVPLIFDLCFWGGLYGAVFGVLMPQFTISPWICGLITGIIAALVGLLVVSTIKGMPISTDPLAWVRSLLINGFWGIGLGLIAPVLMRREPRYA